MKDKILLSTSNLNENSFEKTLQKNELFISNSISDFELKLESYLGFNKRVVALNSGTSAIHLALILAGVTNGDEVICQSFTFSASANPIIYQGAIPIFIDSEKDTWNMCPDDLEKAIKHRIITKKKPKAIIVVHSYGMPAKIEEIVAIANKFNIIIIEDAAEALGASYKKQKCGTFGEFGVFSFNENKIITTSGGGALVCSSEKQKQKAVYLATQARDIATHYQHSKVGYNYRMSSVLADIGKKEMEKLDINVALRRKNNQFYKEIFSYLNGVRVLSEPSSEYYSNHWLTCVVIDENLTGFSSEELRLTLLADDIESRPLWKPMHLQPVFKDSAYYGGTVAEDLFEKGLCLPSGSNLTINDRDRITKSIKKLL